LPSKLKKITVIKSYLDSRKLPVVFLDELQKAVPEEIAIKSIRVNEQGRVTLRCQAVRLSDVFKFVTTLENVKYFRDVQTKYTRKVQLKEREVTDFELDLSLLE